MAAKQKNQFFIYLFFLFWSCKSLNLQLNETVIRPAEINVKQIPTKLERWEPKIQLGDVEAGNIRQKTTAASP